MYNEKYNRINFKNIELFLKAIDLTNDEIYSYALNSRLICYYLATGDDKVFCKNSRKILKQIDFNELLIDVEAALLIHDSVNSLIKKSTIVKMYDSNYWDLLYKNVPSTIDGYDKFIEKYQQNFKLIINSDVQAFNAIIYSFLEDTIVFMNSLFSINKTENKKQDFLEYSKGNEIVKVLLEQKNMKENPSIKTLFKNKFCKRG